MDYLVIKGKARHKDGAAVDFEYIATERDSEVTDREDLKAEAAFALFTRGLVLLSSDAPEYIAPPVAMSPRLKVRKFEEPAR